MPTLSGETEAQEATTTDTSTETAEATAEATESAEATANQGENTDPWAGIPDEWAWTRNAVEAANREAASRRVALRELEERVKDAKTPEEFSTAIAAVKASEEKLALELARERAARTHGLSDELLEFLTAAEPEAIEAQAAKLASLRSGETVTKVITQPAPAGGAQPSQPAVDQDGRKAWAKYREKNRR